MPLHLPEGKRLAVCVGPDLDAQSVWTGTFGSASQSHLSRGEFGAVVGTPRVLALLAEFGITTTWCVPTHTMLTFPEQFESVMAAGHEIGAHGVWHEPVHQLEPDEERRLLELQLQLHERLVGRRPRGYRSPAFDVSASTLPLLDEHGFAWDSSLMGRDFEPYHPRTVVTVDREAGNTFSPPAGLLEIPVSWYLDDFPEVEMLPRHPAIQASEVLLRRWTDSFDFAHEHCEGGVMALTVHPQSIGRGHHLLVLRRFLEHVARHGDVWFPTLSQVADSWREPAS